MYRLMISCIANKCEDGWLVVCVKAASNLKVLEINKERCVRVGGNAMRWKAGR